MVELKKQINDKLSLFYIFVSLIGLCILVLLTNKPISSIKVSIQKELLTSLFMLICVTGIIAGMSPSRCSRIFHFRSENRKGRHSKGDKNPIEFKGHHPICVEFSTHVLRFRGKTYCAGCTGLITGAVIALIGSFLYFITSLSIGEAKIVFWLGFFGVACGLLQYNIKIKNSLAHFLLNVTFVLGAFFLLVGVNEIAENFVTGLFLLSLICYWIVTRTVLSQLEHKKICATCGLDCNFFKL